MQIFIHCKTTLHVSGVTAPIIKSIKNCTRSLRYRSYYLYRRLRVQFLILLMMGAVTPETCRVVLQWINICILLHLLDFYSHSTLYWTVIKITTFFVLIQLKLSVYVPAISSSYSRLTKFEYAVRWTPKLELNDTLFLFLSLLVFKMNDYRNWNWLRELDLIGT